MKKARTLNKVAGFFQGLNTIVEGTASTCGARAIATRSAALSVTSASP